MLPVSPTPDPAFLSLAMDSLPWKEAYALLANTVVPRPIAFVSTISAEGVPNLAPFSFFVVGGSNPPSIVFSPVVSSGGIEKDTLRNIRDNGEYVVNLVHRTMAEGMNRASASIPPHESEWDLSGFTGIPSHSVKPDRVAESWVQFECKLFSLVEHGHGPGSARYIIGEIVTAHIASEFIVNGKLQPEAFDLIARLGGANYLDCGQMVKFRLDRPS